MADVQALGQEVVNKLHDLVGAEFARLSEQHGVNVALTAIICALATEAGAAARAALIGLDELQLQVTQAYQDQGARQSS